MSSSNPPPPAAAAAPPPPPPEAEMQRRVRRKKDFARMERVDGRMVNVLQGLELHTGVFCPAEQQRIVDCVHQLQDQGRRGLLRDRTYSEPRRWMRGKGRATIQFGCCYNYATDRRGNPPGIIRDEDVDPIPPTLRDMVRRLVQWRVLPDTCVPDSCIVNIYDVGDCIPPHIDHHDFVRPFCTVSFLAECSILFGRDLRAVAPGEFAGPVSIPLPVGSVLVLAGNGADVAKHCVPAVPAKRISITFRKMQAAKIPLRLHSLLKQHSAPAAPVPPPVSTGNNAGQSQQQKHHQQEQPASNTTPQWPPATSRALVGGPAAPPAAQRRMMKPSATAAAFSFSISDDHDFPALGALPATKGKAVVDRAT